MRSGFNPLTNSRIFHEADLKQGSVFVVLGSSRPAMLGIRLTHGSRIAREA